jgi:PBSX family phage terminase large subunit
MIYLMTDLWKLLKIKQRIYGKKVILLIKSVITFISFSIKQLKILMWWMKYSPYHDYAGIIADGSIRAGKTLPMSLSFVFWAMSEFDGQNFGMCGKSVGSFHRNVWSWLKPALKARGYSVYEKRTGPEQHIIIRWRGHTNYFYIFGGKDEGSQDLIQGITLAGIYLDEVALMPESFVNQGTGRCSVEGAKFWFNCNPDGPMHWFKTNWIDKVDEKKILHLHFIMDDNPSLSEETKSRYKGMWVGVFYERFILGLWKMAQGAIYKDSWSDDLLYDDEDADINLRNNRSNRRYILIDYGTQNATTYLDVIDDGKIWWAVNQYYHSGHKSGQEKSDSEYADDLAAFIDEAGESGIKPTFIVVDPSAASFKVEIRKHHFRTKEFDDNLINADHEVLNGIRTVSTVFHKKLIRIHRIRCKILVEEVLSYCWDDKAIQKGGKEKPLKINDHSPDALRYGCRTLLTDRRLMSA